MDHPPSGALAGDPSQMTSLRPGSDKLQLLLPPPPFRLPQCVLSRAPQLLLSATSAPAVSVTAVLSPPLLRSYPMIVAPGAMGAHTAFNGGAVPFDCNYHGHQLLLPPADWCTMFGTRTASISPRDFFELH